MATLFKKNLVVMNRKILLQPSYFKKKAKFYFIKL